MRFKAEILTDEEQQRIHAQSLRILEEVGIRYYGSRALRLLAAHGAKVDEDSKIAKIPRQLIEHALQCAPKAFVLGARNPKFDFNLPANNTRFCMDGTAAFALDFETGERRYGLRRDIQNAMRIFQQLELGWMAWAPTTAVDTPAPARALHEFFEMARYCSKHGQHELHTVKQVPYLVDGLKAILGSEDEIRARKAYSLIYCPVAPLSHDGEMLDAYLELGELEMPVMVMPMPIPGTTGPASLFANICLANAEVLSALVVYQLAHPGRAVIYSSAVGSLDFKTGGYLGGTPEMGLQSAALTMMGRFYGLPSTSAGCTSDALDPGPQAVLEKLVTTLPPVLVGADIIVGIGEIEGDQLLVLEQMIIDHEIACYCQRLCEGVDTSEEKSLFEDIARVGPGGHFLTSKSTRQAPRGGEFYFPAIIDRFSYEAWTELGRPSMHAKARQKVRAILEGPRVDPLPEEVDQEIEEILRAADKELEAE